MARVEKLDFTMLKKKLAMQEEWTAELIAEAEQFVPPISGPEYAVSHQENRAHAHH